MTRALVTGFGAYATETDNPSGLIAQRLDGQQIAGLDVVARVLPVDTELVHDVLAEAIESLKPAVVVLTGVAPGRTAPAVERVAVNVRDFPIPDTAQRVPIDEPVVDGGPAAYLSTLPVKAIVDGWRRAGLAGYVSNTAGTYLCNQVFYLARHLCRVPGARVGMVHLPVTPARSTASTPPLPSVPVEVLEHQVRLAVSISAEHQGEDLRIGGGAIS
ncbi:peptidase C15 [Mycolicibacterium fortuitum]|uniref:Pyroglutamyl-peptidase I n=1 Tax=Mycolicibacterium fortuitum subsp. fortuitum DSM 46621 = ATCC 6841 = JCM 6387 TaxID=1214102 RepID=K0V6B5_MYCFO|nr:peptidase C15 [Mycolicibacterium fortuitum]AIY45581.1 Pyrrolidone-carboxylate peptidase [Mycobacterium sp. VKM Ac-1817D]EJZ13125.1 pyroglutamyl-peptidase I [Mycolicibacterium fortuitum subsp. fortuitum DSM 46621 = ATCC 6841 = JCM 6387]OBG46077.1 peptidase C15 [Mycolicibacterium fortuitum]WEV34397.1 peptidase C15 [Mycolicibacterium fortuitum]CRL57776.1 pyrrolidone-carboxylate peptidase [Mycolicibacterium fortuitum subsp. fortuitum DSM 46621 = ATCC 6841 = JCM 6387]